MRSMTTSASRPLRRAISPNGSAWNPANRSSEIAKIAELIGSETAAGTADACDDIKPMLAQTHAHPVRAPLRNYGDAESEACDFFAKGTEAVFLWRCEKAHEKERAG